MMKNRFVTIRTHPLYEVVDIAPSPKTKKGRLVRGFAFGARVSSFPDEFFTVL